ncbi:MAG: hypothetical protein V1724_05520 [Chloroflexota bacterium]
MTQRTVEKTVWTLALLMMASLLWTGCSQGPSPTNPALPPGFTEAQVPAGDISAYLYVSQDSPVTIPTERFGNVQGIAHELAHVLQVRGLALWTGQSVDSFAGNVKFAEESSAEIAQTLLSGVADVKSSRDGVTLKLVSGSGEWAEGMESALKANQGSPFKDAYPAIWDLLHLMPEAPPGKPVAVGFVHVNEQLMNSLATQANLDLSGVGQAFGAANVSDIAFIAYAESPLALPNMVGPDYFKQAGLGAVFVARSSYPGFVLSFFLGSFADRVGLEKGPTVKGQEVLVKEIEGAHLMVATLGNTFFVALAPTREKAEALMTSALAPHVKG